ncbi:MAG: extracellular solute-binding protein [Oscillospiraceae bacterium]|nr:extracellular solute-binding protein [Oscillospiraceae bacterium]
MRRYIKIIISAAMCLAAAMLSSCGKQPQRELDEDGRTILYIARPADEGDTYYAGVLKGEMNRLVYEFNHKSEKYVIKDKYYESGEKLLLEIMSGRQPDLLYKSEVCNWVDSSPLYGKGLLCDLNEFIDENGLRDRYVQSVLEAMEVDGKLYEMPYDFMFVASMVRAKDWGDDKDTSFEHIIEKSRELGFSAPVDISIHFYDAESFTPYVCDNFIDYGSGTCSFESEEFKEYMTFRKQCIDAALRIAPDGNFYDMFHNGDALMMSTSYTGLWNFEYLTTEYVGEEVKFVGLPSGKENSVTVLPVLSFSVFKGSEEAYDFIDYATSYEAYKDENTFTTKGVCLPTNEEVLRYMAEQYYDGTFSMYDSFDENAREAFIRETYRVIRSINGAENRFDSAVNDILNEETADYFDGSKTLEEVCGNIQNRVSLYLSEQYR